MKRQEFAAARSPHRNNAAEWIMWFCLLPVFGVLWIIDSMKK
jgi:hypothetical protein